MDSEERMPILHRAVYGSGEWSGSFTSTTRSLFLNYFLVTVVGMLPATVGILLVIGRIWDAINDPLVGTLSDRLQTRWGRRRPLLLAASFPLGISFALLWTRPATENTLTLFIYFLVVSLVLDTMLTLFSVPHTALLAEISSDYNDRTNVTVWRNAFTLVGALIAGVLFKWMAEDWLGTMGGVPDVYRGYMLTGWIFGLSLIVGPILIFLIIKEPRGMSPPKSQPLLHVFRHVFGNRPFRLLSTAYFLAFTGLEFLVITFVWYLQIVLKMPPGVDNIMIGVLLAAALVTLPLTNLLVYRLGKLPAYIAVGIAWAASVPLIALFPPGQLGLFIGFCIWLGFIYGAGTTIPWTMLPDIMEHDELQTGTRSEGAFAAYMVFFRKLGSALAILAVNLILDRAGFLEGTFGTDIVQPATVEMALRLIVGVLPTIMVVFSLVVIRKYPITQAYHEELKAALRARKQEGEATTNP